MLTELVTVAARLPVASLVALAPLAGLLWMCGAVTLPAALGAMALVVLVVMTSGFLLARAAGTADMPTPAAWVLGIFATSVAVYALVLAFDLLAATAFAIWTVVVLFLGVVFSRHAGAFRRIERSELLGLVVCAAMTLLWCRHSAEAPAILERSGVLPVWIDYLIHGSVISSFGDALAQGRQSIDLAGFPRPFYHYASYLLPAAFAAPLDLPGLPLATSVWLPLGFFTFCAGAYLLGQTLAGPAGGVGAVAILTLVPEAGDYGLRNAFFDFDWHVITHPGSAFALGIAFAAFAFLKRWCDERRPWLLALSIALAAALLFFRAHIFVLALPCVVATAVIATTEFRRRPLVYLGATAALLVAVVLTFGGGRALQPSLAVLHNQPGIAYAGWYDSLLQHYGTRVAVPVGVMLVFPAFLGVFTVLYPIALWLRHRSAFDAVPLVLIAGYAALMVLAPIPADGEATELTQRPFALVYAAVAIWTAAAFVERLSLRWVLAASVAAFVALWPQSGAWAEWPKFSWGWNYYARAVTPGVVRAAAYLRKEGRPGDEFAVRGLRPGWVRIDAAVELAALSGMPAYIARPYIHTLRGGERELAVYERKAVLEAVELETTPDAALAHLGAYGISWYVVTAGVGPPWDPERRRAAFIHGKVAVYRTTSR